MLYWLRKTPNEMLGTTQSVELSQSQSRRVLRINAAITFLGNLDTPLLLPVMSLYAAELGASAGIVGLIIGMYSLTHTPANILFGRLIDRVGYKMPLIGGLIGDALSMFLYSLAQSPIHLALVRAFHGISGSLIGPATMSITAGYSEKAKRGRAMSIYGVSLALATLVGFGLGGVISSRLDYKALFLFGAAMLVVGVVLGFLLPGKKSSTTASTSAGGGFAKAKDLLRRKGLVTAYSAIFAQYFAFGGVVTLLPFYVKNLGMGSFHVGMLLAIFAIVFIILQFPSGAISDRMGRIFPTIAGLSLGMVSLVVMPFAATFPLLAVAMALYGAAYGMLFPSISALVADNAASDERGMATGIFHAFLTAGVAIGAPVIGWVGGMVGTEIGLRLSATFMVVALVIALTSIKRS